MKEFTVQIDEAQEKALLTNMSSIKEWIRNMVNTKAEHCMDEIVREHSDKNPDKITAIEKRAIVMSTDAPLLDSVANPEERAL